MLRTVLAAFGLAAVGLAVYLVPAAAGAAEEGEPPMLAHNVYFSLKHDSAEARAKLIAECKQYLSDHPGTVFFAAGTLAEELDRPVNDQDFDVALHVVFENKAAHDRYQEAEKHLKFIEENKDTWTKVRVFDSYVTR